METPPTFEEIFPKLPKLELMKSKWGELKKFPDRVRMLLKVLPESIRGMEENHLESAFIKKLQNNKELEGAPETIEFHRSCITLLSFLTKRQKRSIERGLASFIKRTYNLHNVKPHSRGWIIYGQKSFTETHASEKKEPIKTGKMNEPAKTTKPNKTTKPHKINKTHKKKETNQKSSPNTENNLSKIYNINKQESSFQNHRKRKTSLMEKERSTSHKKQNKIQNTKKKKKPTTNKQKHFKSVTPYPYIQMYTRKVALKTTNFLTITNSLTTNKLIRKDKSSPIRVCYGQSWTTLSITSNKRPQF
ncbi:alpha-tubulin n-acetyltransferase [Anaeramoeba flamelloides]|uniref:Alpha-tubulin n-acetyltransferase n=1 Tax=Anaeramoeba flamelloides TaxID=1746091 RepID=A0AAV7Y652_9EUKA|nr:alpha-tubulin n-acetyltransferase [Anaeramoeba flamelloides]